MSTTLQRAVSSFYNLIYEAQTFATNMARIDTAEQEHYAGKGREKQKLDGGRLCQRRRPFWREVRD